ncbi:MAG: U32 family peptidase [Eubacteriales bacterium]
MNIKKPELLSPAGSPEKLEFALLYGADAVYLAAKDYGMRAGAENFTPQEIADGCSIAHASGKKAYITINTMPRNSDIDLLPDFLKLLQDMPHCPDAVIAADLGVVSLVKKHFPRAAVHISTQANTSNYAACTAWHEAGADRVVLSRELSLDEIARIRDKAPPALELECFVHGAMCVSYSGRCLLSNHFIGRDANRGMCAQPCRWRYTATLTEEKRPNMPLEAVQTNEGTFLLSSRDLCMVEHVDKLIGAGIDSFKIEGRMKSAYYTAVITNAYRMAIDAYIKNPSGYVFDKAWLEEILSVSHREYDTGFYFDKPIEDAKINVSPEYIRDKAFLGLAIDYEPETGLAVFSQRNRVLKGARLQIVSPYRPGRDVSADTLLDAEGNPIDSAPHPLMTFKLHTGFEVKRGDILRES